MERRIRAQKRKCTALHTAVKSCEDPAAKAKLQEKYTQSAKRLQDQNAAYTKFCTDNDLKLYHDRLAVAGWDRSAASTASAAGRKELDKYKKYHYNKDGTIVVTDDWTSKAKPHVPGQYRSYAVVDTASMGGKQRDRTFFDADGWQCRQISNGPHGNPKRHPYGAKGEHAHDITWDDDRRQTRATRELTDQERKENADIL